MNIGEIFKLIRRHGNKVSVKQRTDINDQIVSINNIFRNDPERRRIELIDLQKRILIFYWPINAKNWIMNMSLKQIFTYSGFVGGICQCFVKYSNNYKKFIWQLAFNNKFYVFCTDRYKFNPQNAALNKLQTIVDLGGTAVSILFKGWGIIAQLLKYLTNHAIKEWTKPTELIKSYDFCDGFNERFTSKNGWNNIISNSYDLKCFVNILSDYYSNITRAFKVLPRVYNNVTRGTPMRKVQAKKDLKNNGLDIDESSIDEIKTTYEIVAKNNNNRETKMEFARRKGELAVITAGLYLLPGGPILLGAVYGSIFKDYKNDSECDGSYVKATKKFIVGLLF